MRKIKFRGQDKVNQRWLYGNLEIPLLNQNKSKHFIIGYSYGQYQKHEVDPKTVGQYTGLKDNNGKEIYEGDILTAHDEKPLYIEFSDKHSAFCFVDKFDPYGTTLYTTNDLHWGEFEVIGNIYDNPELLENIG